MHEKRQKIKREKTAKDGLSLSLAEAEAMQWQRGVIFSSDKGWRKEICSARHRGNLADRNKHKGERVRGGVKGGE